MRGLREQREELSRQITEEQTTITQLRNINSEERAKFDVQVEHER